MRIKAPHSHARGMGFTILEITISLAVFSIVSIMVVTSFLELSSFQRKNKNKQDLLNELRFALDLVGQEITSGSAFPSGCENGCSKLVFATKIRPEIPLRRVEYGLDAAHGIIVKGEQKPLGPCATIPLDAGCYLPISPAGANIQELRFYVENKSADLKPLITIAIQGEIESGTKRSEAFEISSSFSPRLLQDPNALAPSDNVSPEIVIESPTNGSTYATGNSSIALSGVASDNVAVTEVRWRNETTGSSGFASASLAGFLQWDTPQIALSPGVLNTVVMEARDGEGNLSTDTLLITSTIQLFPDLIVTAFSVPSGIPGQTVTASVTIRNQGNGGANTSFEVATNRQSISMGCATTEHAAVSAGVLAAGAEQTLSLNLTLPPTAGSYTAVAMADSDCAVAESIESNNTRTVSYSVTSPVPDIVITAFSVPPGTPGQTVTASITIQNQGTGSTNAGFEVAINRQSTSMNCATAEHAALSTSALAAGATRTLSLNVAIPFAAGSYTAVVMADSDCGIAESVETNNTRTAAYSVKGTCPAGSGWYAGSYGTGCNAALGTCWVQACRTDFRNAAPYGYPTWWVQCTLQDPVRLPGGSCVAPPPPPPPPRPPPPPPLPPPPVPPPPPPPAGTFTISASPTVIRVGVSGSATTFKKSTKTDITVSPSGGFSGNVSLSASGGPTGIRYVFSDAFLRPGEYDEGSSFHVIVLNNTPIGTYTLTVVGTSGGVSRSVRVILDVFAVGGGQI